MTAFQVHVWIFNFSSKMYYDYEDFKSTWNQNFYIFYFTSPYAFLIDVSSLIVYYWLHVETLDKKYCFSLICNKWKKKKMGRALHLHLPVSLLLLAFTQEVVHIHPCFGLYTQQQQQHIWVPQITFPIILCCSMR